MTPEPVPMWLLLQRGVMSRQQAIASGITPEALRHRLRPAGPWRRLLPGIYLTSSGVPTRDQLEMAAMLHGGSGSVITGATALRRYRIRGPEPKFVDVLIPAIRKRPTRDFVVVHRTRRMPQQFTVDGALRFALPARAVADTVRDMARLSDARAVVASAIQQRNCRLKDLTLELRDGPVRGSARLREVLAEVAAGIRSVPEGDLRRLIMQFGLPIPLFNPTLFLNGEFLAIADAWWPDAGLIVEIDSREWHLLPEDWEKTMQRHARLAAAGIRVIHVSPRQLRDDADRVVRDIAAALRNGQPVPGITTVATAA